MDNLVQKRTTDRNDTPHKTRPPGRTTHGGHNGKYGKLITNNAGVFQGPSISALLFAIYLDGVMEDYMALTNKIQIPLIHTKEPTQPEQKANQSNQVNELYQNLTPRNPRSLSTGSPNCI